MGLAIASAFRKFFPMIRFVIDDLVEVVVRLVYIRAEDKSSPRACFTPENAALLAGNATAEKHIRRHRARGKSRPAC
jgi:hypothetical protein